jgi:hypothetical protein
MTSQSSRPVAFFKAINPIMLPLLNSRIHPVLSRRLMELSYRSS